MKHYLALLLAGASLTAAAETAVLDAGKRGAEVSPTMYGIFFEDINYGADGGLYAEMVKGFLSEKYRSDRRLRICRFFG